MAHIKACNKYCLAFYRKNLLACSHLRMSFFFFFFLSKVISSDFFFLFYGLFPDHSSNSLNTYFIFHSCHLTNTFVYLFFPITKLKSPKYEELVFSIDYPRVLSHMEGPPNVFVEWINLMVESVFPTSHVLSLRMCLIRNLKFPLVENCHKVGFWLLLRLVISCWLVVQTCAILRFPLQKRITILKFSPLIV